MQSMALKKTRGPVQKIIIINDIGDKLGLWVGGRREVGEVGGK